MTFRQVKSDEWMDGDYRPFADIIIKSSEIEKRFETAFESHFEEGLGISKFAFFVIDNGRRFFLREYMPDSQHSMIQIFILNNEERSTKDLDEVLELLELTSKDIIWLYESIKFHPHELWRQDDNGHKFLIETFPCRADAAKALREFESRKHKQTYWLEKV